ncbi:MAG TPA: glutamate--tRNA ligase [Methanothrix sp.]|nr:glutamate--tRNA ligase [Methanothrix sp.]HRW83513.1 glutamate--tRNA ligase [Methanothrix sp.]
MADDIREIIEKYALQNAVKYRAAPQAGAVMGKLMGERPELRARAKEVSPLVASVLAEVAKTGPEVWERRLAEIAPELLAELGEKKEPDKGLPQLDGAEGGVVMRFAPNPNGPPTIGSARGIIINSEYVKRYGGKFLLRFDDTDPVNKRPMLEAYGWYLEDSEWLGAVPDEVVIASDRLPRYYEVAEELIRRNGAYVCRCDQATFKALKDAATPCPHRDQSPEENMALWNDMMNGGLGPGEAVLRVKTEIAHKDPALRDWAAFRIVTADHPRVGERYRVWPLLDFESAVEDHFLGVTTILRGKDLMDSERRQRYLYGHMGWEYPTTIHWGRIKIHQFGSFSTSALRRALEAGEYSGWDDARMPTVRALRRRGIRAEALRKFMIDLGVGETDISISMDSVYAENRKIVDPEAKRRFFVKDPVPMEIEGEVPSTAKAPFHPTLDMGYREIPAGGKLLVSSEDLLDLQVGASLRLKDLCNIEILSLNPLRARVIGTDPQQAREMKLRIIHWAPTGGVPVRVMRPDGVDAGIGELGIKDDLDKVVQFERYGFVRIDSVADDEVIAYFAHR